MSIHTGNASTEAASFHVARETIDLPVVARFTIDGEPVSKARARFTNYGSRARAYTPEKTLNAEKRIATEYRRSAQGVGGDGDRARTFGVVALFFNGTRQRRDVDNMLKLVLDGLNGVAWADDNQVVEVTARKAQVPNTIDARTEVLVYVVGEVQRNTKPCAECQREFDVYRSTARSLFCSRTCAQTHRAKLRTATCEACGSEFDRGKPSRTARFCSTACRSSAGRIEVACSGCGNVFTKQRCHLREVNYCTAACRDAAAAARRVEAARGVCEKCSGPVSKKSYRRCRACHLAETKASGAPQVGAA